MSRTGLLGATSVCLILGLADIGVLNLWLAPRVWPGAQTSTDLGTVAAGTAANPDNLPGDNPVDKVAGQAENNNQADETPTKSLGDDLDVEPEATAGVDPEVTAEGDPKTTDEQEATAEVDPETPAEPETTAEVEPETTPEVEPEATEPVVKPEVVAKAEPDPKPDPVALPEPDVAPSAPSLEMYIYYETGRANISAQGENKLRRAAAQLKSHPGLVLVVEGHADHRGENSLNWRLSQLRARVVVAFLKRRGVTSDRIRSKSYGENAPLERGVTEEAMAKNRRVRIYLEEN